MIEQSFTTGTVVPRWVRTVEPLSPTAHRQELKNDYDNRSTTWIQGFPFASSRLRVKMIGVHSGTTLRRRMSTSISLPSLVRKTTLTAGASA
ncbi:MAG: hypothetical protein ACK52S_00220, partial [Pirellula sp.]